MSKFDALEARLMKEDYASGSGGGGLGAGNELGT
tara:strand:- start:680 stop:781 length:102 start_codon:yes stop_codon:yes gene_type:complete